MPRIHKHVLGTKYRRNYDPNCIEEGLQDIVENNLSFRQAAERHGVPSSTLYKKYRGMHGDKLGRPTALSIADETALVKALFTAADYNFPFTRSVLQDFIQQYLNQKGVIVRNFVNNRPGADWCDYFHRRHPELSKRNAQNIKRCRADVTKDVIQEYFDNLSQTIEGIPVENIINYDETNITDDPGTEKVFARRGSKRVHRIMDSSKSSTSIMFAVSADGTLLPIYVVYKAKYLYPHWIEGGPDRARYNRTKSGWFDSDTFEDWFFSIALPYLSRKEGRKLIIGDNLGSHLSYAVLQACQEHNIAFVFLPKNSTHICQPLDVAVFRPLKYKWKKILTKWKQTHKGVVPKTELPSLLKLLLDESSATLKTNILSGFEATGIAPFNPDRVLSKITPRWDEQNNNNDVLVQSFSEVIQNFTQVEERVPVVRKRKLTVPAGKSVSTSDIEAPTLEQTNNECSTSSTTLADENGHPSTLESNNQEPSPHNEHNSDLSEDECSSDENTEDMNDAENVKTAVKHICDIEEGCYIVASFIYNANTKKECTKQYVAKVTRLSKKNIEVSCLRSYKEKRNAFVYPTVDDIVLVKLSQIKYRLTEPIVVRGIYSFTENVI